MLTDKKLMHVISFHYFSTRPTIHHMRYTRQNHCVKEHKMIPYTPSPVWISVPQDIFLYQTDNMFDMMMEYHVHTKDWTPLQSVITQKRMLEKKLFITLQQHSHQVTFLEDVSETQSQKIVGRYLLQKYLFIQRFRFAHLRSHIHGMCDGLIHRELLLSSFGIQDNDNGGDYVVMLMKPSFTPKKQERFHMEATTLVHVLSQLYPGHICDSYVTVVDKDLQFHTMTLDKKRQPDMLTMFRTVRKVKKWAALIDLGDELPTLVCPNMKTRHSFFEGTKHDIAVRDGEITLLWKCDVRERKLAFDQRIFSWKDPRFSPEILGWTGNDCAILQRILDVNRGPEWFVMDKRVLQEFPVLTKNKNHVFVDFEYVGQFLYLIGVFDGVTYRAFWSDELSDNGTQNVWQKFQTFLDTQDEEKTCCWYWYAEERFMEKAGLETKLPWYDLFRVCRYGAVRHAFDFSLKSWVKAFHLHGKIPFDYNELQCQNGASSLTYAYDVFEKNDESRKNDLELYNRYDCEAMWYIFQKVVQYVS